MSTNSNFSLIESLDQKGKEAYDSGRYGAALVCLEELRELGVHTIGHDFTRAQCLYLFGRIEEALALMEELVAVEPNSPSHLFLKALLLSLYGRHNEAYQLIKKVPSDHPEMHSLRARFFLRKGEYRTGMEHFLRDAFLRRPEKTEDDFASYLASLENLPLSGKRIFIRQQGGLGDAILFARLIGAYHARGAHVVLGVHPLLKDIFARLPFPPEVLCTPEDIERFPCDLLMSDSVAENFLALHQDHPVRDLTLPYLFPREEYRIMWGEEMKKTAASLPRIGIHWSGQPDLYGKFLFREVPYRELLRFAEMGTLYSFQRDKGARDVQGEDPVAVLGPRFESFEDTLGALANLDLLVTGDACIAHLAGAAGIKTALLVHMDPYFTWVGDTERSEWYPSVTVFRQKKPLSWREPIEEAFVWARQNLML